MTRYRGERLPGALSSVRPFGTGLIGGGVFDETDEEVQLLA